MTCLLHYWFLQDGWCNRELTSITHICNLTTTPASEMQFNNLSLLWCRSYAIQPSCFHSWIQDPSQKHVCGFVSCGVDPSKCKHATSLELILPDFLVVTQFIVGHKKTAPYRTSYLTQERKSASPNTTTHNARVWILNFLKEHWTYIQCSYKSYNNDNGRALRTIVGVRLRT